MSDWLALKIKELSELDRAPLLVHWKAELNEPSPSRLRRQILLPLLLYKIQEKAHGGLKPEIRQRLRKLARSFAVGSGPVEANLVAPLKIKPGTRLSREWQGKTYHVAVSEHGFEYGGQTYKSLSHIARTITGTRWSGPLFFGLKRNDKKEGRA